MSGSAEIGIVGGGFSGSLLVWQLVRQGQRGLSILWCEGRARQWGRGVAYGTDDPVHWLNVPVGNMSADPDQPGDFLDWLTREDASWRGLDAAFADLQVGERSFMPRRVYGEYLQDKLAEAEALARERGIRLQRVTAMVGEVERKDGHWHLPEIGSCRQLVLAVGHVAAQRWPVEGGSPLSSLWNQPIPPVSGLPEVAILGTGLSMVDAVMSLNRQGFDGVVHAFSRHARLPWPHRLGEAPYDWQGRMHPGLPLAEWKAQLETALRQALVAQPVIDALRPLTNAIWQGWTVEERRRFWHQEASLWAVRRHRIPPASAAVLHQWQSEGRLQLHTALELTVQAEAAAYRLRWREEGEPRQLTTPVVLNATGAAYQPEASGNPLLRSLVRQGLLHGGASGKGAALEGWLSLDRANDLWLLGPLLQDQALESTAVPEIRVQAKELAGKLC